MDIGVDFGGTKIEAAAIGEDGRFRTRLRRPTRPVMAAVQAVRELVDRAEGLS
jgi:fructokinase